MVNKHLYSRSFNIENVHQSNINALNRAVVWLKFLLAFAIPAIVPLAVHSESVNFDIAGIRFGMTQSEVESALKVYDPKIKIRVLSKWSAEPDLPSTLASIEAIGAGPAEIAATKSIGERFVVFFGQFDQKSYFIGRNFTSDKKFKNSILSDAASKKYRFDSGKALDGSSNSLGKV